MISAHIETLSTSAELLVSAANATTENPLTVVLTGGSADTIFIGGYDVDATKGYPVNATTLTLILAPGDDLWAIASEGTPTINVLVTRANAQA